MRKIVLFNQNQIIESISNICFKSKCNPEELKLSLLETKNEKEFLEKTIELTGLPWKIVKANEELVQLSYTDTLGNVKYLKALLDKKSKISEKQKIAIKNILLGNNLSNAEDVLNDILFVLEED